MPSHGPAVSLFARCTWSSTARRLRSRTSSGSPAGMRPSRSASMPAAAMERSAAIVQRLVDSTEPAYGVSTGFGSLANVRIDPDRREELQRALIRSHAAGMGPPVEREVVRAMMLLRARTLAMGYSGARPVVARDDPRPAQRRRDAGRPRAWLAWGQRRPGAPGALRADADRRGIPHDRGRRAGGVRRRDARRRDRARAARREGGPGADQRHRRLARDAPDGDRRPGEPRARGGHHGRALGRGAARHRPGVHRGPRLAAPAAGSGGERREHPPAARRTRTSSRATATATRACRTPTRCGARRWSPAPRGTRSRTAGPSPSTSWRRRSTTRWSCPTAGWRRAATSTARPSASPAISWRSRRAEVGAIAERRTDRLLDVDRSHGLPAVPRARRRRQLGADDRPIHAGGDRRREPPPGGPRERRLAPVERDAGGPCLDELGRRPQAPLSSSRT